MGVSFLVSFKILTKALTTETSEEIAAAKKTIDFIGDLYNEYDQCTIWATVQAKKKIIEALSPEPQKRFDGFFQGEPTTADVAAFDHDSSISESAKNLSRQGPTVVIVDDQEKSTIPKNQRIIAISPEEFNKIHDKANEVYDKLPTDRDFLDLLLIGLFNPKIFGNVE